MHKMIHKYVWMCKKSSFLYSRNNWIWPRNLLVGTLVMDRITEIRISGTQNQPKNGFKASWTRLFFIFGAYLMIFQSFEKNGKKWRKKPCTTCLKPIFRLIPDYPKIQFWVSDPTLHTPIPVPCLFFEKFLKTLLCWKW